MGLFSFVKDAAQEAKNQQEQQFSDSATDMLRKHLESLGLNISNLSVTYQGGHVVVSGEADTNATREKVILAIGNLPMVSNVEENITVAASPNPEPTPEPESQFYTVVKGDTLSKIAKEFYGNAMKYPVIFEANKPMLSDPDKIYVGQVLRIPAL